MNEERVIDRPIFVDGSQVLWELGPLRVEYNDYGGPSFWIGEHRRYPGPLSPWWLLWRVVKRRIPKGKEGL